MGEISSHKPEPKRVGSHVRVDCSCGWRGPVVALFGHGHAPWAEHYKTFIDRLDRVLMGANDA